MRRSLILRIHPAALIVAALVLSSAALSAHDMWIEPTTFAPAIGEIVGVKLRVGENLLGDPLAVDPALVNQFLVADTAGEAPVVRRDGSDPAGLLRVASPGLRIIGYRSNPSAVETSADKFNQYLKEEGLDAIIELRARRHESGTRARDLFARCAKSLVFSGPASAAQRDRRLGFPLELVAERNPYALRDDETLPVRLTYENKALAGALVVAFDRRNPSDKIAARTDRDGRVQLRLRRGGMWLVKAVHMIPAPPGAPAEWASFWASLTFEIRSQS